MTFARLTAALLTVSLATVASATPIYSTGFEAPEFVPGNLVGQSGWDAIGLFSDDIVSANVQTTVVKSGSQAVSLTAMGQGAGAFAYRSTPHTPSGDDGILIDVDMQWGTAGSVRSAFYALQAYDTQLDLIGSVGISQVLGIYNAVVFDAGGNPIPIPGATVTPGQWYHFQLLLDYETQTYQGSMNGLVSPVISFQSTNVTTFGEADLMRDAGLNDANDIGYFDNLSIQAGLVPEPASALVAALGLFVGRRRI